MRVCSICGDKHSAKGLCGKHYQQKRRAENGDIVRAQMAKYRDNEARRALARLRSSQWRAENPGRARESQAACYVANRKKRIEAAVKWARDNPEKASAIVHAKRARKAAADGRHSAKEIATLLRKQRKMCAVCRVDIAGGYHKDHIQPLSRGGSNWIENIQLLCKTCNLQKHAKDPLEFMRERGLLL